MEQFEGAATPEEAATPEAAFLAEFQRLRGYIDRRLRVVLGDEAVEAGHNAIELENNGHELLTPEAAALTSMLREADYDQAAQRVYGLPVSALNPEEILMLRLFHMDKEPGRSSLDVLLHGEAKIEIELSNAITSANPAVRHIFLETDYLGFTDTATGITYNVKVRPEGSDRGEKVWVEAVTYQPDDSALPVTEIDAPQILEQATALLRTCQPVA